MAEVMSPYWLIKTAETAPDTSNAVAKKMNVDAPPSAIITPHSSVLAVLNPLQDSAAVSNTVLPSPRQTTPTVSPG